MNVSLSSTFPSPASAEGQVSATTAADAETAGKAAEASPSKLSEGLQVHQLKEEGQSLSQISVDLDLTISAVGNDLLINVPKIPAITQTPPANAVPSISLSA